MIIELPVLREAAQAYIKVSGITQAEFAEEVLEAGGLVGLTPATIGNFIRGKHVPHRRIRLAISDFLRSKGVLESSSGDKEDLKTAIERELNMAHVIAAVITAVPPIPPKLLRATLSTLYPNTFKALAHDSK